MKMICSFGSALRLTMINREINEEKKLDNCVHLTATERFAYAAEEKGHANEATTD